MVLGELLPVRIPRRHDEVTVSSTFAYALLLVAGAPAAMLAHAMASAISDARAGKGAGAIAFNAGQVSLSLAATGGALELMRPGTWSAGLSGGFDAEDLGPLLVGAVAFFLVNNALVGVAQALTLRDRLLPHLREDLGFHVAIAAMLLGLVPIVLVVTTAALWLLPLLALPIVAVYMSGRQAVINDYQATHDALTDLPNRVLFRDRVSQAILAARRHGGEVAVMLMDLDRFQEINDTLGHRQGDLLLRRIGPELDQVLRSTDTVARLGGDEYAVLLPHSSGHRSASDVAERVLERLDRPFVLESVTLDVSASIGIACFPAHGEDVDTLIQRADVAMYWAKAGGTGFEVYAAQQDQYSPERLALVGELRRALEGDEEIVLLYQPKVELRSGRVTGVEALVRWRHPAHGLLPPNEFIPIAERTGLIRPLTSHVMAGAVRQVRGWKDEGLDLTVAVNLSGRTLLDESLPDDVARVLEEHGVDPGRLEFEITESTLMADPVRATGDPRPPQRNGDQVGHRRLRDGVLLAQPAQAAAGRRDQDRQVLRARHGRRQGRPRDRAVDDRPGSQSRPGHGGGGRGGSGDAGRARPAGLQLRPGLLHEPADLARGADRVAQAPRPLARGGRGLSPGPQSRPRWSCVQPGTRPPSAPRSEEGPRVGKMPSTRMAFSPRPSRSRPSLEPTSSPVSSRTRSSR